MRRVARRACWALAAAMVPAVASADIRLSGFQHIGDDQNTAFTPSEPMHRADITAYPDRFSLSQPATITAVSFENPVTFSASFSGASVIVDGIARSGTLAGTSFRLNTPLTLAAGLHSIVPDPGCSVIDPATMACTDEHDVGFSAMVLVSSQTTSTVMLSQRRHIGDDSEAVDDDYGGRYYPDAPENPPPNIGFSLDRNQTLGAINIYRLRDVEAIARLYVDDVQIGSLTGNGNPYILEPNRYLPAGNHTLRIEAGSLGTNDLDSISWDDILLFFGDGTGNAPGRFNAVDVGENAVTGAIRTKIAGNGATLALYALDQSLGSVLMTYSGTVHVELLDAHDDSGTMDATSACLSSWSVAADLGTTVFAANGTGTTSFAIQPGLALRQARVRVTDVNFGVYGCSSDAFAIRPASVSVQVSQQDANTAGTATSLVTASPTADSAIFHRAGRPLTIRATGINGAGQAVSGYDGTPETAVSAVDGLPANVGDLVTGTWATDANGARRTDTAVYSEVGYFALTVSDSAFANVDIVDGSTPSQRTVPGPTLTVGRFTPDHFVYVVQTPDPVLAAACSGAFTYIGQPLAYQTAPVLKIKAVGAAGNDTGNYVGDYARLAPVSPQLAQSFPLAGAAPAGVTLVNLRADGLEVVVPTATALGAGAVQLLMPTDLQHAVARGDAVAPFALQLRMILTPAGFADLDGVAYFDPAHPTVSFPLDPSPSPAPIAFAGGASQQRFGRLTARNASGPETEPLLVNYYTETYVADGGFAPALDDSCTQAPGVTVDPEGAPLPGTSTIGTASAIVAGAGSVTLTAAGAGNLGSAGLLFRPIESWLLGQGDPPGATWDQPAAATVTFGIFNGGEEQIDLREIFR